MGWKIESIMIKKIIHFGRINNYHDASSLWNTLHVYQSIARVTYANASNFHHEITSICINYIYWGSLQDYSDVFRDKEKLMGDILE